MKATGPGLVLVGLEPVAALLAGLYRVWPPGLAGPAFSGELDHAAEPGARVGRLNICAVSVASPFPSQGFHFPTGIT